MNIANKKTTPKSKSVKRDFASLISSGRPFQTRGVLMANARPPLDIILNVGTAGTANAGKYEKKRNREPMKRSQPGEL